MTETVLFRIAPLCIQLERSQNKESLRQHLSSAAAIFDTPNFLLGVRGALEDGTPAQTALTNYSREWQDYYDSNDLHKVNPYLRRATGAWGPFRWDDVEINEQETAYKAKLAEYGMVHGMVCTFHTLNSFMGMLVFNGSKPLSRATWPQVSYALHLFCSAATRACAVMMEKTSPKINSSPIELSGSERHCLELAAQGYTVKEIAADTGLPERRIRYYMDRVAAKLNVSNKREAVAEALSRGLIRKRHFGAPSFKGSVE